MRSLSTRTGDHGETGMPGGRRVRKDDPAVEACGELDELNCHIGLVRSSGSLAHGSDLLGTVQADLFVIGSEIAARAGGRPLSASECLSHTRVAWLEDALAALEGKIRPLRRFILPGGCSDAAHVHVARAVCRRAERRLAGALADRSSCSVAYLNRLSDVLFALARVLNASAGVGDHEWQSMEQGDA